MALGLTQEELAKKLGLKSRSSICNIEKGTQTIPFNDIEKWANALCVTPFELMGYADDPEEEGEIAATILLNPELMDMNKAYLKLSRDKQKLILDFVKTLSNV